MIHVIDQSSVELLCCGKQFFPAVITAADRAQRYLWLETYIFADDVSGQQIANALIHAAGRGVDVRVVIDGFGSHDFIGALADRMKRGGIKLAVFKPERSMLRFRTTRLRRLHRKLILVDDDTAFVGGINIIDDLNMSGHGAQETFGERYDFALKLTGEICAPIRDTMQAMWERLKPRAERSGESAAPMANLGRSARALMAQLRDPSRALADSDSDGVWLRFIHRDNVSYRRAIENMYLAMIAQAKTEIFIANAYFFPRRRMLTALRNAEARGVRVRLLLQGRKEYFLQHYATHALYDALIESDIEIAEYTDSFLHAKVAVIDGRYVTVGSSNVDPFSLMLAREANVFAALPPLAAELKIELETAWAQRATVIERKAWKQRGMFYRWKSAFAYWLARVMLTAFGLSGK